MRRAEATATQTQHFRPGGKYVAKDHVRKKQASQHELVARLIATLQADWPEAYARCYVDKRGLIVCMFAGDPGDDALPLSSHGSADAAALAAASAMTCERSFLVACRSKRLCRLLR